MKEHSEFTFFPDRGQRHTLLSMSPQDMARLVDTNPGMSGRFIHEWLRKRSERIVYEALLLCQELPQMSNIIIDDILLAAANMAAVFEINEQKVNEYLATAYRVVFLAVNQLLFHTDPDMDGWREMEREVAKLIKVVEAYRKIYPQISNAKWN